MTSLQPTRGAWHKSSHSGNEDSYCVEVAQLPQCVAVRDSKDPLGPELSFPPAQWAAFISAVKGGRITG